IVTSHYRDGVTVHDASDPSNIILTGYYDSNPESGQGFNGSWGAWPYLPSGIILNADIEEGLFILQPTYTRAARLEGTVTSASNGVPLSAVSVSVVSTAIAENTGISGTYAAGLAQGGTFDVTFIKGGFLPVTVSNVQLVSGQTTVLDVQMTPDIPFTLQVNVTETPGGDPVEGATITFTNSLFDITATTDVNGVLVDENFFDGTYEVTVGHWGHVTQCGSYTLNADNNSISIQLQKLYYDDFALDFGWEVTGAATTGVWERGAPIGTDYEGNLANPDSDSGDGCGNFAFITGNAGPPVNIDDVDDGATILTSPSMDLSDMDPGLSFQYWFYTGGGSSASNDEMLVRVSNGIDIVTLESLPTTGSSWHSAFFALSSFITITDNMQVQFHIQDAAPGHLVEGGIDHFVIDFMEGVADGHKADNLRIFPNPSINGEVFIANGSFSSSATVRILDLQGRELMASKPLTGNPARIVVPDHSGIYLIEVTDQGERSFRRVAVAHN
ncbi:MAG: carboxypeptidase regulatory-like domain-containing protein, partial [Flavobacteriales bacterium]|nr:carboxypeptidase regulatory-like domain-containing protein [Flavobacteriales bacterium]